MVKGGREASAPSEGFTYSTNSSCGRGDVPASGEARPVMACVLTVWLGCWMQVEKQVSAPLKGSRAAQSIDVGEGLTCDFRKREGGRFIRALFLLQQLLEPVHGEKRMSVRPPLERGRMPSW